MGFRATMYGSQNSHNPWMKCHENEEKIDNDVIFRNDHRIKTTQPISMMLVSFFSEDNVLSDEMKICYSIFEFQSNEYEAFRCSWGHPVLPLFTANYRTILPFFGKMKQVLFHVKEPN